MNPEIESASGQRKLLVRALFMLVMILAYQISVTLLFLLAAIQFVIVLVRDVPNGRLAAFGVSLGIYLKQIVHFLSFASEEAPFPFSDWPPA